MVEDDKLSLAKSTIKLEGLTLKDAIRELSSNKEINKEEAVEYAYWEIKKKYRLIDTSPPKSYWQYLMSLYSFEFWAILVFALITYASVNLLPQNYPIIIVRYICTFFVLLILPGMLLIENLTEDSMKPDAPERVALSLILSFLLSSLLGFALILTNMGFNTTTIVNSLLILTIGLAATKSIKEYDKSTP